MVQDIKTERQDDGLDHLVFKDGDFDMVESDQQHIQDIIESFPGWWKEYALLGVGISDYINSAGKEQEIQGKIALQLRSDGYQKPTVSVNYSTNGDLTIETDAVRN